MHKTTEQMLSSKTILELQAEAWEAVNKALKAAGKAMSLAETATAMAAVRQEVSSMFCILRRAEGMREWVAYSKGVWTYNQAVLNTCHAMRTFGPTNVMCLSTHRDIMKAAYAETKKVAPAIKSEEEVDDES
jgi:hypothetical protein